MHEEVLSPETRGALARLVPGLVDGFYLGGGTAVALHLGHRVSEDLDWFTAEPFSPEEKVAALDAAGGFAIHAQTRGSLHGAFTGVRVSFLHYPYPMLAPLASWRGARVAGLLDLGLMKLSAIGGRGARRDFVDLYAICRRHPLAELVAALPRKYGIGINLYHTLKSLTYFADAEEEPMPRLLRPLSWEEVKACFQSEAVRLFQEMAR